MGLPRKRPLGMETGLGRRGSVSRRGVLRPLLPGPAQLAGWRHKRLHVVEASCQREKMASLLLYVSSLREGCSSEGGGVGGSTRQALGPNARLGGQAGPGSAAPRERRPSLARFACHGQKEVLRPLGGNGGVSHEARTGTNGSGVSRPSLGAASSGTAGAGALGAAWRGVAARASGQEAPAAGWDRWGRF